MEIEIVLVVASVLVSIAELLALDDAGPGGAVATRVAPIALAGLTEGVTRW